MLGHEPQQKKTGFQKRHVKELLETGVTWASNMNIIPQT